MYAIQIVKIQNPWGRWGILCHAANEKMSTKCRIKKEANDTTRRHVNTPKVPGVAII